MKFASGARVRALISVSLCFALAGVAPAAAQVTSEPPRPKTFWPSAAELRAAAGKALRDPGTWLPAAGAAMIAVAGWDRDISDWAVEHHPIFGSSDAASEASDNLRLASHLTMITAGLVAGASSGGWSGMLKYQLVDQGGAAATTMFTSGIKDASGRMRPDGSNHRSFPSGHTASSFALSAFSVRNINSTPVAQPLKFAAIVGSEALALGTGWARVEAGAHYPTDVLVGAALGNFVGSLVHHVFIGRGGVVVPHVSASASGVRAGLGVTF